MSKFICKRYRYVASLEEMQRVYAIAEKYSTIQYTDKEYSYNGDGILRNTSYVQDGDRYYKITSMWIEEIKDKEGKEKKHV